MLIDRKWMRYYAVLSGAVLTKIALIVGGMALGTHLDRKWNTAPLLSFLGIVIGMALGLAWVIYVATRKQE